MGIELKPDHDDALMVEMNTTPLVDVMLVLIIMLIITIPLQTHTVVMALGAGEAPPEPAAIRLELGAGGELHWDGAPLAAEQLDARLAGVAAMRPQPELQLRVHPQARYGAAAEVLTSARRAGMQRLGIEGTAP